MIKDYARYKYTHILQDGNENTRITKEYVGYVGTTGWMAQMAF